MNEFDREWIVGLSKAGHPFQQIAEGMHKSQDVVMSW